MTNNGNILAQHFTYLGLKCECVKTKVAPQFEIYYMNCLDIKKMSISLIQKLLEKIRLYSHLDYKYMETTESTFAITCPLSTKATLRLDKVGIGAIGKDMENNDFAFNWNSIAHILVAGTTGSGKSVFINTLINSLMISKDNGLFVLIDPKRISFAIYKNFPNVKIITEVDNAFFELENIASIMEQRYQDLENGKVKESELTPIYVIVDELADLMLQTRFECENTIIKLCQKARQVKIHLILATQRPTANVVSGLIKANCDTRVCLRVASVRDSVVVLDHKGGEDLIGYGDSIISVGGKETRVQIAYCDNLVNEYIKNKMIGEN